MKTLWVLGHQLTTELEGFRHISKSEDVILMIESRSRSAWLPYHKQKLVLIFSAMRHFAARLKEEGYRVDYRMANTFTDGLEAHFAAFGPTLLIAHWPTDWTMRRLMDRWAEGRTGILRLEEDALFLVPRGEWPSLLPIEQKSWRMEHVYQKLRQRFDVLLDGDGRPVGGKWNFDADNRKRPDVRKVMVEPLWFAPDAITRQVMAEVVSDFGDHPGNSEPFGWPVTRADALAALAHFVQLRLPDFGDQQDAMLAERPWMAHSLVASAVNIGLLAPLEVVRAAEQAYSDGLAPLAAVEGFIRQVLGWREYVRGVYVVMGPGYGSSNVLGHTRDLPAAYWGEPSGMRCVDTCVSEVLENGYSHHIQRLMVLGNYALLLGVEPQQVNRWFNQMYVDAFDWVVTPNVIGMSQHADGGRMASKPYVSAGAYIRKMSDYCAGCAYDVGVRVGERACPFNALYWAFIARHEERWKRNPRMSMVVAAWRKMPADEQSAILAQAAKLSHPVKQD